MARYLETADQLRKEVESFVEQNLDCLDSPEKQEAVKELGHIVNLAIRCNPRQSQGTVRKNIVATAMRKYCKVTMTKEYDERTGNDYNKIHIQPRS